MACPYPPPSMTLGRLALTGASVARPQLCVAAAAGKHGMRRHWWLQGWCVQ